MGKFSSSYNILVFHYFQAIASVGRHSNLIMRTNLRIILTNNTSRNANNVSISLAIWKSFFRRSAGTVGGESQCNSILSNVNIGMVVSILCDEDDRIYEAHRMNKTYHHKNVNNFIIV